MQLVVRLMLKPEGHTIARTSSGFSCCCCCRFNATYTLVYETRPKLATGGRLEELAAYWNGWLIDTLAR